MNAYVPWPAAVIFDLDGTLVDSAPDIAAAVNVALADYRLEIDAAEVRDFIGDGAARLIERVLDAHDIRVDDEHRDALVDTFQQAYHAAPCTNTRCYPGVHEMLTTARTAGRRLAVCTNKPQAIAEQVLDRVGIAQHFEIVVGAGAYRLKPDPEPLQACLSAFALEAAEVVYVGDMQVDCEAGHAAGLPVVLAQFGYADGDVAAFAPEAVLDRWHDWPLVREGLDEKRRSRS